MRTSRRRECGVAAVCTLLMAAGCATSRDNLTATRWDQTRLCASLQLADEHMAAGKFERARGVLTPFEGFADPRVQLMSARMDLEEGSYAAALRRLDAVNRASPGAGQCDWAVYHRLRGIALEGLGRWGEAAREYQGSFELDPSPGTFAGWIDTLVLNGQTPAAAELLQRERHRFPGQVAVHMLAARLSEQMGDRGAAIDELATAALAEPENLEIRRRLAELYTTAGRYDEAIASWQRLVDESRGAEERRRLRHRLAGCLMSAERFEEARRVFQLLASTQPDDLAAQSGLSAACLMVGEAGEALAAALRVLRTESDDVAARALAALSYRRLGQYSRATELLSDIRGDGNLDGLIARLRASWE